MLVLGIETSCDETSAAVVEDGRTILSNVVATQIPFHKIYNGVVPEIASRKHIEWITPVVKQALKEAQIDIAKIDAIAATNRPGLVGGLLIGLTFGKSLAYAIQKPFIAVNHMLGHLYASNLVIKTNTKLNSAANTIYNNNEAAKIDSLKNIATIKTAYPFLGLLVSGGHTIICVANNFDDVEILGTTVDDSIGEAFDKVAKFYGLGYPGGVVIDKLSQSGDKNAAKFPLPKLDQNHKYDLSYSGLKTAVIHQREMFWNKNIEYTKENLCASFQEIAIKMLVEKVAKAQKDTGLKTIVAGGGVAANSRLRTMIKELLPTDVNVIFPPLKLCGDNGAMIAGVGYQYLIKGERSALNTSAYARVKEFKHPVTV